MDPLAAVGKPLEGAKRPPASFLGPLSDALLRVAEGGEAFVSRLAPAPVAQRRVDPSDDRSEALFETALSLRKATGIPFWDAVFLAGEQDEIGVTDGVAKAALLHQKASPAREVAIPINDKLESTLLTLSTRSDFITALTSRVVLPTGAVAHIPMIDFASKSKRPGSARGVEIAARNLLDAGSIVNSGRSYHLYGHELITRGELFRLWSRAILLSPIVDARWVAHQQLEGFGSLRISPRTTQRRPELLKTF